MAWTVIESIGPGPVSVFCTVVIGAITTSSSLVAPLDPLEASTPTTSKLLPLTLMFCPTALCPANSSWTTVCPITATRLCWLTSAEVNEAPSAIL